MRDVESEQAMSHAYNHTDYASRDPTTANAPESASNAFGSAISSQQTTKPPPPFSLCLTREERATLEKAAAGMPLGAFIKEKLFDGEMVPRRTRGRTPVQDHTALAKVLAALGASRMASNLNQIAKAVNIGALPVSPELEDDLQAA
ncbi:MAG: hypothetical protein AAGF49_05995, partial [Pseudomonadota bacterium]